MISLAGQARHAGFVCRLRVALFFICAFSFVTNALCDDVSPRKEAPAASERAPVPLSATPEDPIRQAERVNREYLQKEHEIVYADPALRALHEEISRLESQLVAKRKQLTDKLAANEELRNLQKKRYEAFRAIQAKQAGSLPASAQSPASP